MGGVPTPPPTTPAEPPPAKVFVVETIDWDGGRPGRTWQLSVALSREGADRAFAEMSAPADYGRGPEPFEPFGLCDFRPGHNPPSGFVKAAVLRKGPLLVQMREVVPWP